MIPNLNKLQSYAVTAERVATNFLQCELLFRMSEIHLCRFQAVFDLQLGGFMGSDPNPISRFKPLKIPAPMSQPQTNHPLKSQINFGGRGGLSGRAACGEPVDGARGGGADG